MANLRPEQLIALEAKLDYILFGEDEYEGPQQKKKRLTGAAATVGGGGLIAAGLATGTLSPGTTFIGRKLVKRRKEGQSPLNIPAIIK